MVQIQPRWLTPVILFAVAVAARAQPAAPVPRPDPLDPNTNVPASVSESTFGQYRRLGEDHPISWRDANDTVTRIGGWRTYAREAQQPEAGPVVKSPATLSNSGAVTPAPPGPGGQKKP